MLHIKYSIKCDIATSQTVVKCNTNPTTDPTTYVPTYLPTQFSNSDSYIYHVL